MRLGRDRPLQPLPSVERYDVPEELGRPTANPLDQGGPEVTLEGRPSPSSRSNDEGYTRKGHGANPTGTITTGHDFQDGEVIRRTLSLGRPLPL